MALYFEVDDSTLDYSITAIPSSASLSLDQNGLLKAIIEEAGKVKEFYDSAKAKYGKLLGQGRITLLELTDSLFTNLLLFSESIKSGIEKGNLLMHKNTVLKCRFENKNAKITGNGFLFQNDIVLQNDFGKVYESMILDNMKQMLVCYREMVHAQDGRGDATELFAIIDAVLYSLIVIRYNIKKCSIDR